MKSIPTRSLVAVAALLTLSFGLIALVQRVGASFFAPGHAAPVVARTWNGGGATNNWSDAANWSGDVVPGPGDDVIFNGTSTKDAAIDTNFSVSTLQVNSGYTGTVSLGNSTLSLSSSYVQAAGTFNGGSGVLNISADLLMTGGSFSPAAGTVAFNGTGFQNLIIPNGFSLNNLTINKAHNTILTLINGFVVPVNGTLTLTDGQVHRNSFDGLEARGEVNIAPTFDGVQLGNPSAFLDITGNAARTVTFPVGAKMLHMTVNAPNVTLNASGSGTFTFEQTVDIQNAAGFTNGDVDFVFASAATLNGFTQGSGDLTFNFTFTQTAGTFVLGSGALTFNSAFILSGGTFNAPAGTLSFPSLVQVAPGAVFNHNNGTIEFNGTAHQTIFVPANAVFPLNDVLVNKAHNTSLLFSSNGTVTVLGTLTLTEGGMDLNSGGTKIDAQGDVIMAPTFDGSPLNQAINLQISGPATRTVSFPVGAKMLPLIVNSPNVTVTNHGVGTFTYSSIDLQSAAGFTSGDVDIIVNGAFTLGATTVTQGSGDINFLSGGYFQNAGAFVPGSGELSFGSSFQLFGGTFTAPTSTISFQHTFQVEPAGTFNPNGGTVQFNGIGAGQNFRVPTPAFTLHNVIVNRQHNTDLTFFNSPSTLVTTGTLQLLDGRLQLNSVASVDAQGDVIVGPNFDGGQMSNFRFTGPANQTYTNNGGVNVPATWRVNKPPTAIVTAATDLALTAGQQLIIDSGILYLNENSDLTTSNTLTVSSPGKLMNDSSTTITLGGSVTNNGRIDLDGGGAGCPGNDTILVRSTSTTQRTWQGGSNRLIDVDVQNMGGTSIKRVFSGTDSGGNNTSWTFDAGCPTDVSISPGVAGIPLGTPQLFTAGGGIPPYAFSLPVNNSGATLGSTNGVYVAGNVLGAVDTVRVTDAFGSTADAIVTVTGPVVGLGFVVQPSNAVGGQAIAPPVMVATQDANGNTVTSGGTAVSISIANNPSGGTLSGTLVKLTNSGVATFDNLSINNSGNGYTLRASGSGTPGISNAFNITGAPTQLEFVVQPTNAPMGGQITPPVQVAIRDASGTTVPTATSSVTIAIGNNPNGGILFGTVTRDAVAGIATFDNLAINNPGSGYTLVASATGLVGDTSAPFNVTSPAFVVTTQNTSGPGSLRQAILDANAQPGADTINFNILGVGPIPIFVGPVPLPVITDPVTIDGTTQPGYAGTPVIEIRGSSGTGLDISAGSSTVRGLSIVSFADGVRLRINDGNVIQNNFIGVCVTCGGGSTNGGSGIKIEDSSNNLIGGSTVGARNVISGNQVAGIEIPETGALVRSHDNTIQGNYIGTMPDGTTPLANGQGGIVVTGDRTIIGGTGPNQGNRIAFNLGAIWSGVTIEKGVGNAIRGNSFQGNAGPGITLRDFEFPVDNDFCDADIGPNKYQNTPVLTGAIFSANSLLVTGTLNSFPNQTYSIDFFLNSAGDPSGFGEGETFIGSTTVSVPPGCESSFGVTFPVTATHGQFVTATATDAEGNTSQFSALAPVTASNTEVINTEDGGLGSLRQAILNSNSTPGTQLISFNIPGSAPLDIIPMQALPTIIGPAVIDATTQPGYAGTPLIRLRRNSISSARDGLNIIGSQTTIRGLAIFDFPDAGIRITTGGGNSIQSNYIGADPYISLGGFNGTGILILASSNNVIGGVTPAESNVIAQNNTGIEIRGDSATGNLIQGNYIGRMRLDGAIAGNFTGVRMVLTGGNTVGGTSPGARNTISGNTLSGIDLHGASFACAPTCVSVGNTVQGNLIGIHSDGTTPNANGYGITIHGGEKHLIGGTVSGAGNRIAFSVVNGITATDTPSGLTVITIRRNEIFSNGVLGIDLLQPSGITPNDPGDADVGGANSLQNFPVLTSAISSAGVTVIQGTLNSSPVSTFALDFFSSPSCDASGNGEGETFLGSANVTTDAGGIAAFSSPGISLPVTVAAGRSITATATDTEGNTSEFSRCQVIGERFQISGRVSDGALPVVRAQVQLTMSTGQTRSVLTTSNGNYAFGSLVRGNYTVTVNHPSLTFTPATRTYTELNQNQINQNFDTSVRRFTLRGQARTTAIGFNPALPKDAKSEAVAMPPVPVGGFPLLGVTFNVTGPGINRNVTSDSFGNYRFDALPPATYVLTPTKPNYVFNPPLVNVTIGEDETVNVDGTSLELSTLAGRIVYDAVGGIKAINADGSGLVTILPDSTRIATRIMPRFSENGQRIAFLTRSVTNAENKIFTVAADGSNREFIYEENARLFSPVYSPDGARIAFHNNSESLVVMDANGANVETVRNNCTEPDWSPDGTRIVCVEEITSSTDRIITVTVETGQRLEIDATGGRKFSPRWSPDGTRIAFIRRQSGTPATHSIVVKTLLGGTDSFMSGTNNLNATLSWSPDSARLLFIRDAVAAVKNLMPPGGNNQLVTIQASDGQNMLVIDDNFEGERVDWGTSNSFATPPSPTPTVIQSGAVSINFPSTSGAGGFTTVTPIEPSSAGSAPNGFVIGGFAFEISTTAEFTPPITICIDLDDPGTQFGHQLVSGLPALMHNENGMLVNITTSYDPQTEILCGQTNSFSPFVVAEQIDSALPSIAGLIIDSNGAPMNDVAVSLSGAEQSQTQTDSDGLFRFVNLVEGGNYNVQPQKVGYLFEEYNQDFVGITGEGSIVFRGTAGTRDISGKVADPLNVGVAGITVTLDGSTTAETVTDANGNYLFSGLAIDGTYFVSPSNSGLMFTPGSQTVSPLVSDMSEVNFTAFAPTAANVSVGGRVLDANGQGISKAKITLADPSGVPRVALTNAFGYYRFDQVEVGGVCVLSVEAKQHQFENPTRTINVVDDLTDVDFTALPRSD